MGNVPATALDLDLEVLRRDRPEGTFQATGDPQDAAWLQGQLRDWLRGHKWSPALWSEFELVAREAGTWTKRAKVRA